MRASILTGLMAVLVVSGCFDPADRFRSAIPSQDAVAVKMPDGSSGGATAALALGETALLYSVSYDVSRVLNGGVFLLLGIVGETVERPPTSMTETVATWGPYTPALSPVTYRLDVTATAENTFTWVVSGRPRTSTNDNDYVGLLAGNTEVLGEGLIRGDMALDRGAISALDVNSPGAGAAVANYDTIAEPRVVEVALDGYAEGIAAPVSALYRYSEMKDTSGTFELMAQADTDDPGALPETLVVTSRWIASGSGRGDAVVTSGDLAAGTAVEMSECWDDGFGRTFYTDSANMAPTVGTVDVCAFADPLFSEAN
jgi:hypothetical protein